MKGNITKREGYLFMSQFKVIPKQHGFITCKATNINGTDEAESGLFVSGKRINFQLSK